MTILKFDDIEDLANTLYAIANDCEKSTTVAVYFKEAAELLRELLYFDDIKIGLIELADSEDYDYEKEYYVSLLTDPLEICIEEAWNDKRCSYLMPPSNTLLLHGDVNSLIAKQNNHCECFEVKIGDDEDEEDECFKCPYCGADIEDDDSEEDYLSEEEVESLLKETFDEMNKVLKELKDSLKKETE